MRIEYESGDVVQVGPRPSFVGRVVSPGPVYLHVTDTETNQERIILRSEVAALVSDVSGEAKPKPIWGNWQASAEAPSANRHSYRFQAKYSKPGEVNVFRTVSLDEHSFVRASTYLSAVPLPGDGYTIDSIVFLGKEESK